jgi:hypothetical protein
VLQKDFGQLVADGQRGVQRLAGILEDHGNPVAPDPADPVFGKAE